MRPPAAQLCISHSLRATANARTPNSAERLKPVSWVISKAMRCTWLMRRFLKTPRRMERRTTFPGQPARHADAADYTIIRRPASKGDFIMNGRGVMRWILLAAPLCGLARWPAVAAEAAESNPPPRRPLVGAIRWDAWHGAACRLPVGRPCGWAQNDPEWRKVAHDCRFLPRKNGGLRLYWRKYTSRGVARRVPPARMQPAGQPPAGQEQKRVVPLAKESLHALPSQTV